MAHFSLSERGSAAVEFAVILPVLVIILAGIFDYAQSANISTKLYSAARAGAQYAFYHPGDTAANVQTVAGNATSGSGMRVLTPTTVCRCIQSSTGAFVSGGTVTCPTGTTVSNPGCTAVPGNVCDNSTTAKTCIMARLVTVIATRDNYAPLIGYKGIGNMMSMKGSAQIQVP